MHSRVGTGREKVQPNRENPTSQTLNELSAVGMQALTILNEDRPTGRENGAPLEFWLFKYVQDLIRSRILTAWHMRLYGKHIYYVGGVASGG